MSEALIPEVSATQAALVADALVEVPAQTHVTPSVFGCGQRDASCGGIGIAEVERQMLCVWEVGLPESVVGGRNIIREGNAEAEVVFGQENVCCFGT